jgi:Tfp pilus assembly protein PilF
MTFRIVALAIVLTGGVASAAEDSATLEKMVEMNRKALDQLRTGQNAAARDGLLEAIVVGKRAGLGTHQMMARTYLHLGAVYLTGFGDRDKAMKQFEAAVKIRPNIQLTPAVLTPTVQEVFEAARAQVGGEAPAPAVEAKAEPEKADKSEKADKPEAKPEAAEEPKAETHPEPKLSLASEPRPRAGRTRLKRPAAHVAEHTVAKPAEPDPSVEAAVSAALEEPEETSGRDRAHPFWAGLGIGSAVGFHGSRPLEATNDFVVPAGFSVAAAAAFTPEIGYRMNDRWAFSLQSRHQLIPVSGTIANGAADTRHHFAHAIFARAHYRLYDLRQKLELWGTGTVGGGSAIRLWVRANPDVGLPNSDTVAAGPVAFGPGVAVIYHATRRVGVVGELRGLVTVGGFAALADVSLGASCSF